MEEESALRPGYRLDRYELVCPVASGGMAAVWLAQLRGKRGFEKLFAIKTIKGDFTEDTRFQEMFLDEARIASGIEHPNVAHIVDLGEQDDTLYIVMEWVDGESLSKVARAARKKGKPLPLGLVLRLMADACAGLHAAHELHDAKGENLGVVHRDVSPHNILVTSSGAVKVIDFGVAKARNRRAGQTAEGVVKGKIRYMAPEQVRNENVDRRSDVWAIGVCLQELATGTLPFDDESDIDVVRKLIDEKSKPKLTPDLPEEIFEILDHSIARDPAERFSTANAMRRAIENAIVKLGLEARSDDVSDFLKAELPELEAKRRDTVKKALNELNMRASRASIADEDEVAYAATVVGPASRDQSQAKSKSGLSKSGQTKSGLTKSSNTKSGRRTLDEDDRPTKRPSQIASAKDVLAGKEESSATRTSFVDDEEVAGLPKNRGFYLFGALLILSGVAWFVWPGKVKIREMVAAYSSPVTPETSAEVPSATASVPPLDVDAALLAASASASANVTAPDAAPAASVPPTATATSTAPTSTHTHVTPTATVTATVTPTATATATPTTTATEDDPNSPY
jgi:eukaryotic-like serine/threonine-protein kinase